jgi:hypothetical protein
MNEKPGLEPGFFLLDELIMVPARSIHLWHHAALLPAFRN